MGLVGRPKRLPLQDSQRSVPALSGILLDELVVCRRLSVFVQVTLCKERAVPPPLTLSHMSALPGHLCSISTRNLLAHVASSLIIRRNSFPWTYA